MNVFGLLDKLLRLLGKSAFFFLIGILAIYFCFAAFLYTATWLWPGFYGSYSLGNNIYMLEWDGGGKIIVNGTRIKGNTCYGGEPLIPTNENQYDSLGHFAEYVIEAKANNNWIIVRTNNHMNNQRKYYILDKRYNPNNTPVEDIVNTKIELYSDSSEFAKKCSIHHIDIKW